MLLLPARHSVERLQTVTQSPSLELQILTTLRDSIIDKQPLGWTRDELVSFFSRYESVLLQHISRLIEQRRYRPALPELWSVQDRTTANLSALNLLAQLMAQNVQPNAVTEGQRASLALYSGWGGLSIEKNAHHIPTDLMVDPKALIHEYYPFFPYPLRTHEIKHLRDLPIRSDRATDDSAG